jgi:hypothetical protein
MNDLLHALGILVLRREADEEFRLEGDAPHWLVRLFPGGVADRPFPVVERFPFLESFLPTAAQYWGTRKWGRVRSGYWIETDPSGNEVPLQASAVHLEDGDYLTVENVRGVFQQEAGVLQKARENALALEKAGAEARALLAALGGRAFRVRGGRVVEGGTLPPALAAEVLRAGESLGGAGDARAFPWGRAAAIAKGEYWAVLDR